MGGHDLKCYLTPHVTCGCPNVQARPWTRQRVVITQAVFKCSCHLWVSECPTWSLKRASGWSRTQVVFKSSHHLQACGLLSWTLKRVSGRLCSEVILQVDVSLLSTRVLQAAFTSDISSSLSTCTSKVNSA